MHIRALRGLAVTVVALIGTVGLVVTASMTTLVQLAATALIMGGTGMKALGDPHQWGAGSYLEQVNGTYLSDLHLDEDDLLWVQTPEHFWPATGLSDISFDTSVARGVLSLNNSVLATPGDKVIVGYSQSANIATREKRNLAELRAQGATVPSPDELSFVFVANPNRPNGGILARFEGLYIPILGVSFDGATPDDEYATIDVAREYDLIADFPKYPLNLLADLNALLGYFYLHPNYGSSVINLDDPTTYQSHTSGNTTYYLVHTERLPLLQPLRDIGFPEPVLALVEPTLRVLIDLGYDRTPENMGVPTRAQLIPRIDMNKLAADLTAAAQQGVRDALSELGIDTDDTEQEATDDQATLDAPEAESETASDVTARPTSTPKSRPMPKAPQSRKSVRDSLVTMVSPVDTAAEASDDAPQDDPRPRRKIRHAGEHQTAQPKSGTEETKDTGSQRKPRREHRARHSHASPGRASVERAG
ncbi:PE-PPE domain-containing protein [Mycolicibacterium boenickei]